MHHAARLLLGLAALTAAGAVFAHTGIQPHVHPHPDVGLYALLAAVVGAGLGALWGRTPFSGNARRNPGKDRENGV